MEIVLCHKPNRCCPVFNTDDNGYKTMKDDFGNKVKFTNEQWKTITEMVKSGKLD